VENRDLGERMELCSVDSDSSGLVRWTLKACGSDHTQPMSKDLFVEQPPMKIV
jgi:hypothetical protein